MIKIKTALFFCLLSQFLNSQSFDISINADSIIGEITPLWNDYWELNVQHGYGPHPWIFPNIPHTPFIDDSGFVEAMNLLQPRSIKVSIGTFVYLPHIDYASVDTSVLKTLPTEFYRGGNSLTEADDPDNYFFEYLDSQLDALDSIGAEPFLNIDYMPFTLASNKVPKYHSGFPIPFYQVDNEIRTVPPQNYEVYGRVVRNIIRHTKGLFKGTKVYGIKYYEIWNEPDHPTTSLPTFWRGTEYELYDMYKAIANEVDNDEEISNEIKLGCCSFAILNENQVTFTENFLKDIDKDKTRLDFLSIHPYSADPFRALDTNKLSIAQFGIDTYAPNAELINAEWGILNSSSIPFVNTLEHELTNFKDVSLMLDRDVKFAHYVNLVAYETSNGNPSLGVCSNDPVQVKVTAVARANMNKLLETPHRLKIQGDWSENVIAGKNSNASKIITTIAAPRPENTQSNTINVEIINIPFAEDYQVTIYELSESNYVNEEFFKIIDEFNDSSPNLAITLNYEEDQNSGRLYTVVLEDNNSVNTTYKSINQEKIKLYPNPSIGRINLETELNGNLTINEVALFSITGNEIERHSFINAENAGIDISYLSNGMYICKVKTNNGEVNLKFIKQ